ncbi:hypothetical protein H2203_001926 [Taxawa tesnikishii (nom. ined.)]|nr:hypothetical protein H2203_001926 [Dothideales sp. JES 119]
MSEELLNIVVLGASFAGLSVAHHFLDYTISRLNTTPAAPRYRLVLISPSTHIYWNIGAPRVLVAPGLIKESDAFIPIEPGFKRHKKEKYTIIQGFATGIDTSARTVTIETIGAKAQKRISQVLNKRYSAAPQTPSTPRADGSTSTETIPYHALVIATGTSAHSDLLSLHGPHTKTIEALNSFHSRVPAASSIVVCGGGPSGVETAGQLATYLNHSSTVSNMVPSNQQKNLKHRTLARKQITLVSASARLLPNLPRRIGLQAEKQLHNLGVKIITNTRVKDAVQNKETKRWTVTLSNTLEDESMLLSDLYVSATGVAPNTAFMPANLLDGNGYMVYAIGDCASYSSNYVLDVYAAVPPLMTNLYHDLYAHELKLASPYGGNDDAIAALKEQDAHFVKRENGIDSQLCPITRRGGVGVLMGLKVPSFAVWLLKGRDYRVSKGKKVVVDGNNPY